MTSAPADNPIATLAGNLRGIKLDSDRIGHLSLFGLLVGALYSLNAARHSKQDSRPKAQRRAEFLQILDYVEHGAAETPSERWLVGYHLNSAALRIAALYEGCLQILTDIEANVPTMEKVARRFKLLNENHGSSSLNRVRKYVNEVKHQTGALPAPIELDFAVVVSAMYELVPIFEHAIGRTLLAPEEPKL